MLPSFAFTSALSADLRPGFLPRLTHSLTS